MDSPNISTIFNLNWIDNSKFEAILFHKIKLKIWLQENQTKTQTNINVYKTTLMENCET